MLQLCCNETCTRFVITAFCFSCSTCLVEGLIFFLSKGGGGPKTPLQHLRFLPVGLRPRLRLPVQAASHLAPWLICSLAPCLIRFPVRGQKDSRGKEKVRCVRWRAGEFEVGESCGKTGSGGGFALLERPSPQNMGHKNTFQLKKRKRKESAPDERCRGSRCSSRLRSKSSRKERRKKRREDQEVAGPQSSSCCSVSSG